MKTIKLISIAFISTIFIIGCSNVEFPWNNETLDEAINNHNKLIMIDFYATW